MKLFDYKFLILLGLTLVVYFIYREIIDLKTKVSTLENKISTGIPFKDSKNNKLINQKINELTLSNTNEPMNDFVQKPIDFQIPLPPRPQHEHIKKEFVPNVPKLVHNMEDSEDIENLNNSGEQVAIYSNDNDKTQSYSIGDSSLIESSDLNQGDIIEDSMNEEDMIPDILTNSDQHLENSEASTESKKKTLMVESEGDDNMNFGTYSKNLNDMSHSDLMKFKLNELQCFAEECKIDILKSNGKKKTKSNLSKDIVEHFSNSKSNSI